MTEKAVDKQVTEKKYDEKVFSLSRLKPPPRKVPFFLSLAMIFNTVGFPVSIFFFFILLGIFSFSHPVDIHNEMLLDRQAEVTRGKIVKKKFISDESSFGGDYRYHYEYKTPDGMLYTGKSQTNDDISKDQMIYVEYLAKKPKISRMKGTKKNFVIPCLFIGITIIIYFVALFKGIFTAKALKNGELADAEVKEVKEKDEGDQKSYLITMEFKDKSGEPRTFKHKTYKKERLLDEPTELVFYDPDNQKNVWPVDEFPIPIEIDNEGEWKSPSTTLVLRTLLHVILFLTPFIYGIARFFINYK